MVMSLYAPLRVWVFDRGELKLSILVACLLSAKICKMIAEAFGQPVVTMLRWLVRLGGILQFAHWVDPSLAAVVAAASRYR